jgi:hypothetical protein
MTVLLNKTRPGSLVRVSCTSYPGYDLHILTARVDTRDRINSRAAAVDTVETGGHLQARTALHHIQRRR